MAYPFNSILSPIQFHDPSLVALGLAKEIAVTHGATLHLLHVVPMLQAFGEPDVEEGKHTPEEAKAEASLREIAAQHLGGVKTEIHTCLASQHGLAHAVVKNRRRSGRRPDCPEDPRAQGLVSFDSRQRL
jgi:nucleotide-binding universal stress UspA family protein